MTVELAGLERREVKISNGQVLVTGWVRVQAKRMLSVSAVIVTRELRAEQEVISQATVAAAPLSASVVIPVFNGAGTIQSTGVAVFFRELGLYRFDLFSATGTLVHSGDFFRQTSEVPNHLALFVNELFQVELPENFAGWIRLYGMDHQARGLAAMALYTNGAQILNAQSTVIDAQASYRLTLQSEGEGPLGELRNQYGFVGGYSVGSPNSWQITSSDEVARALERDPRVVSITTSASAPPISH